MAKEKKPAEIVTKNIYRIDLGFVSMYIYQNKGTVICIDAGMRKEKVSAGFDEIGIAPGSVQAVFLTHSDRDHTGGVGLFTRAKLYLSAEEEQMVNGKTARFLGIVHNKGFSGSLNYLQDGEIIKIGETKIKAILTPGHTPGSMSFLVEDRNLFVGDILNLKDGKVALTRKFLMMNKNQQQESIRKLARLNGIALLATGHSGFTDDFNKAMEGWRENKLCVGSGRI